MNSEPRQEENQSETARTAKYENGNQHENKFETSTQTEMGIGTGAEAVAKTEDNLETSNETSNETTSETTNEPETNTHTQNPSQHHTRTATHSQPRKQATAQTLHEVGLSCQFYDYSLQSKVLFSGIGADELCGGYVRYQAAFTTGGRKASWEEMTKDWNRLWIRNLVLYGKSLNA